MTKSYRHGALAAGIAALAAIGCQPKSRETMLIRLELVVGKAPKLVANNVGFYDLKLITTPQQAIAKPVAERCELKELFIGSHKTAVAYVLSKDKSRIARIWADLDANGKFDAYEEAVNIGKAARYPAHDYLKFKSIPKTGGRPLYLAGLSNGISGLGIVGDAYLNGKTEINGKSVEFKIYDTDLDGKFGTRDSNFGDQISYKLDGVESTTDPSDYFALGFGLYYKPFIDSDRRTLSLIKYTSKLGRIEAPRGKIVSFGLFNSHGYFNAVSDITSVSVPVGAYSLCQVDLEIKGQDGQQYAVGYRLDSGMRVDVKNDKPIFLGFRDRPEMKVKASANRGFITINMGLYDKDGWHVMYIQPAARTKPGVIRTPDPIVTIVDPMGVQVATGTMTSNWTGRYFGWKVPLNASRGKYRASVKWQTIAFGEMSSNASFEL